MYSFLKALKKMPKKIEEFNIVVVGVGGQGLITLLQVVAEAALTEGYDVKTSELHGLSQRGGSVQVHIRFGKKIFSPLVKAGGADLIIALETQESLRACYYSSKKSGTIFLVNNFFLPIPNQKNLDLEEISKNLRNFSRQTIFLPALDICQKEVGTAVTVGTFLLGYVTFNNLIPLKINSIILAIKKIIPEKYLELNIKTFNLAEVISKKFYEK